MSPSSDPRRDFYIFEEPTAPVLRLKVEPKSPPPAEPQPITADNAAIAAGKESAADQLRALLIERGYKHDDPPPKPHPVLKLGIRTISTPGNLTSVQGPVKSGKTAVLEAIIAAVFNGNRVGPDTLDFAAENVRAHAVIHFDTEQSRFDHDCFVRRSLKRARMIDPPPWFSSYCVTDLPIGQRKEAFELVISDAAARHGGVFLVVLDGVADICASPNDEAEAYALIARLHALAIQHDCSIVTVLHENPGSENGKMRGHLGSQLERKAETPLRLVKDPATGTTTIWSDRARHCHLPKDEGVCFAWCDQSMMHVSVGTAKELKAEAKASKFREEAATAFGDAESLSYAALVSSIMTTLGVVQKTAEKRVKTYAADGIIVKTTSGYAFRP